MIKCNIAETPKKVKIEICKNQYKYYIIYYYMTLYKKIENLTFFNAYKKTCYISTICNPKFQTVLHCQKKTNKDRSTALTMSDRKETKGSLNGPPNEDRNRNQEQKKYLTSCISEKDFIFLIEFLYGEVFIRIKRHSYSHHLMCKLNIKHTDSRLSDVLCKLNALENIYTPGGRRYFLPKVPVKNSAMLMFSPDQKAQWELTVNRSRMGMTESSLYMLIRKITDRYPERYQSRFFSPCTNEMIESDKGLLCYGILFTRNSINDILMDFFLFTPQGKMFPTDVMKIVISYLSTPQGERFPPEVMKVVRNVALN